MKRYIFLLIFAFAGSLFAQEVVDKIAAVVGNEIILQSELDFQTSMAAAQNRTTPTPAMKTQVLNAIIQEKLLYQQALLDSVVVTDDEVDRQLDYQIQMFVQQYGSKERVEEAYGMSLEKIKRELRDDLRKNLMSQRVQEKRFGMVEATKRETEMFFEEYKDSLGLIPEKYDLARIFVNPRASDKVKEKFRSFAKSLIDSIKNGADFAQLAKKYSEDPGSAAGGGDLGFVKKGVFFSEFEAASFALNPGEISDVVETPVGFHIIQLLEKRGESIHTRHILIKIKNSEDDDLKAIELLSSLRDSARSGQKSFADLARKYSDDKETARFGGSLGIVEVGRIDKTILDMVFKLKEGEISMPKRVEFGRDNYGYQIVKVIKKIPEHKATLENDFAEIKKLADLHKKQKLFEAWIKEIKANTYWEIRI